MQLFYSIWYISPGSFRKLDVSCTSLEELEVAVEALAYGWYFRVLILLTATRNAELDIQMILILKVNSVSLNKTLKLKDRKG